MTRCLRRAPAGCLETIRQNGLDPLLDRVRLRAAWRQYFGFSDGRQIAPRVCGR